LGIFKLEESTSGSTGTSPDSPLILSPEIGCPVSGSIGALGSGIIPSSISFLNLTYPVQVFPHQFDEEFYF
jgi:hypothetical protein